jgi:hypothetical protein
MSFKKLVEQRGDEDLHESEENEWRTLRNRRRDGIRITAF